MNIRPIQEADFEQLINLFKEFATFEKRSELMVNTVEKMHAQKEYLNGFVVENTEGGKIVGYVTYFFTYYTWSGKALYMDDLYIMPQFRNNSLGSQLIQKVITFAKHHNCSKLKWQVSDWNTSAIAFYKNLGAEIDGVEQNCTLLLK